MHVVNNILSWSRWRIHRDGICAIEEQCSRSIDEAILVGSGPMTHWMLERWQYKVILVGLESIMLHVVHHIYNWSRWRIHRYGICAMEEQCSRIDEAMLVGSGAYGTLVA